METLYLNWEETHDRANNVMTHTFEGGVACIASFRRALLTFTLNGRTIDVIPMPRRYTVEQHRRGIVCDRLSKIAHNPFFRRRRLKALCNELRNF